MHRLAVSENIWNNKLSFVYAGVTKKFSDCFFSGFYINLTELGAVLPELYLHGLSGGDFDLALRGLLGPRAELLVSSLIRRKRRWAAEYASWKQTDRSTLEVVHAFADGLYLKLGVR